MPFDPSLLTDWINGEMRRAEGDFSFRPEEIMRQVEKAGMPAIGRPVAGSDHSLAEHLGACLAADRCAWGEYMCPVTFWRLGARLCGILMAHAGERGQNEGAVDVLMRIIRERDSKIEQARALGSGIGNVLRHFADRVASAATPPVPPSADPGKAVVEPRDAEIVDGAAARRDPC